MRREVRRFGPVHWRPAAGPICGELLEGQLDGGSRIRCLDIPEHDGDHRGCAPAKPYRGHWRWPRTPPS